MSRPIEQALNNLIPRHPGALPPELIQLASSLLAQSRTKFSSLRAEEEIGRTYACANIACERLKTKLNLPSIEPRPPCPPKIYIRLYGDFDKTLSSASSRGRARSSQTSTPAKALPQKNAPAKEKSLDGFRSNRTPKRGLKYKGNLEKEKLPKWVGPAIRKICTQYDTGKAVPHVWAGVESILYLPCPKDVEGDSEVDRKKMEGKLPALVTAIWFHVVARLTAKQPTKTKYATRKLRILGILNGAREDESLIAKVGEKDADWEGWEVVQMDDVDGWLREIPLGGWKSMEWFENIEEGSGAKGVVEDVGEEEKKVVGRPSKRVRRAGVGTMMQPKFDYLSDEKRAEYAVWKEAMLAKIDNLVAQGVMDDDMDTTEG